MARRITGDGRWCLAAKMYLSLHQLLFRSLRDARQIRLQPISYPQRHTRFPVVFQRHPMDPCITCFRWPLRLASLKLAVLVHLDRTGPQPQSLLRPPHGHLRPSLHVHKPSYRGPSHRRTFLYHLRDQHSDALNAGGFLLVVQPRLRLHLRHLLRPRGRRSLSPAPYASTQQTRSRRPCAGTSSAERWAPTFFYAPFCDLIFTFL